MANYGRLTEEHGAQRFTIALDSTVGTSATFVAPDLTDRIFITDVFIHTDAADGVTLEWLGGEDILVVPSTGQTATLTNVCIPSPLAGLSLNVAGGSTANAVASVSGYLWQGGQKTRPAAALNKEWAWTGATLPVEASSIAAYTADTNIRCVVNGIYIDTQTNTEVVLTWGDGGNEFFRVAGTGRRIFINDLNLVSELKGQDIYVFGSGNTGYVGLDLTLIEQYGPLPDGLDQRFHKKIELAGGTGTPTYATVYDGSSGGGNRRFIIDRAYVDATAGVDELTLMLATTAGGATPGPIVRALTGTAVDWRGNANANKLFCVVKNDDAGTVVGDVLVEGRYVYEN